MISRTIAAHQLVHSLALLPLIVQVACAQTAALATTSNAPGSIVRIARFDGDRAAAISYTFDDNLRDQYTLAVPMLNEVGFKGTFFVIAAKTTEAPDEGAQKKENGKPRNLWGGISWTELKIMAEQGHEIASHTWSHPSLTKLPPEEVDAQFRKACDAIKAHIGRAPLTIAFPGNGSNPEVRAAALKYHVACRTSQQSASGKSTVASLNGWADKLIQEKKGGVLMTHGIATGYAALTDPEILRKHLRYVKSRESAVWVDTFANVARYEKERDNAKLTLVETKAGSVVCVLAGTLDPKLYDVPLTLVVDAPGAASARAVRTGKELPVRVEKGAIYVQAAPSPESITVTWKATAGRPVDPATMQRVYDEVKTPFKCGVVIKGGTADELVDCASLFRSGGHWYMMYVASVKKKGYQTYLARSEDLLHWEKLGKILSFTKPGAWDAWQADGGVALCDTTWGGSAELEKTDGKYWLSYIGGARQGYEPDPLAIGMAWTDDPTAAREWNRVKENPVLSPQQPDVREFEKMTLYKSQIIHDKAGLLGWPFVMFYNGKLKNGYERIGMAVSRDMVNWTRYGNGPVIANGEAKQDGISGDPQIVRMGDVWVMFYFGAFWKPGAFDTFACSYDLVNWTQWEGPHLVQASESFDRKYAHKPWVVKWNGVVYHFYCAVGDEGRVIALATSKDLKK